MKKIYKILIFLLFVIAALIAAVFSMKAFFKPHPDAMKYDVTPIDYNMAVKYDVMPIQK